MSNISPSSPKRRNIAIMNRVSSFLLSLLGLVVLLSVVAMFRWASTGLIGISAFDDLIGSSSTDVDESSTYLGFSKLSEARRINKLFSSSSSDASLSAQALRDPQHPNFGSGERLCTLLLLGFSKECSDSVASGRMTIVGCVMMVSPPPLQQVATKRGAVASGSSSSSSGIDVWTRVLHKSCTNSKWWKDLRRALKAQQSQLQAAPTAAPSSSSSSSRTVMKKEEEVSPSLLLLPQDIVHQSEMLVPREERRYVPVRQRTYAALEGISVVIKDDTSQGGVAWGGSPGTALKLYPINFAIPKSLVRQSVTRLKFFSMNPNLPKWCCRVRGEAPVPRIPGAASLEKNVIGSDEEFTALQMARHSFFSFSNRRGNWDCQRHSELLSQGVVPFIPELLWKCKSRACLAAYPKKLLIEALHLPGIQHWSRNNFSNDFFSKGGDGRYLNVVKLPTINWTAFDRRRYFHLADRLLNFTQKHLTCGAMVAHVLRTMGYEEPKSVLLLVPQFEDYLSLTIEAGFAELGINYTTNMFQGNPHWSPREKRVTRQEGQTFSFEKWNEIDARYEKPSMYGNGYVWGLRVDPPPNPRLEDSEIEKKLMVEHGGEFDLVIVSNLFFHTKKRWKRTVFEHMPLLLRTMVKKRVLPATRIAFFDGEDYPQPIWKWDPRLKGMIRDGSFFFMRELHFHEKGSRFHESPVD